MGFSEILAQRETCGTPFPWKFGANVSEARKRKYSGTFW